MPPDPIERAHRDAQCRIVCGGGSTWTLRWVNPEGLALLDVVIADIDRDEEKIMNGLSGGAPHIRAALGWEPESVRLDDVVHVLRDGDACPDLEAIVMAA